MSFPLERVRNIGFIAHIDAGKTTVSERVLFYTGKSHKIGEVHEGATVMDWMVQERERGITITSAATTCFWFPTYLRDQNFDVKEHKNHEFQINLIDTPGHIDFTVEVQRSLRVLDGCVVIFDGVSGVEPQSETVWRQADKFKVPRMCFINKLDRIGAKFENAYQSIIDKLTPNAIAMQYPIGIESAFEAVIDLFRMKAFYFTGENGDVIEEREIPEEYKNVAKEWREKTIERIVEKDDTLMQAYLDSKEISIEDLKRVLRKAVINFDLVPVFIGTALKDKGVQLMLDGVADYLPSPLDKPATEGDNPQTGQKETRKADDKEPFSGLVFKIATDPFVGELAYFRVYSGTLTKGSYVINASNGTKERIGRLLRMHANERAEIDSISAGDIAATVALKNTKTGDTICAEDHPIILENISFPDPVIDMKIEPQTKADQDKLSTALQKLTQEDPTLRVHTDEETGDIIMSGMGELHLDIIIDRLRREFNVNVNSGKPQVAYKETIQSEASAEGKYIRQSGGRGQYGHVWLKLIPLERGKGFEFINDIREGTIPREYIPPVEKGVKEAATKGVVAGFPVVDFSATLYDGSFHEVDSSDFSFKIAASIAFQEAARRAKPILLEPIMKVEVVIPQDYLGDVIGDLSSRRAKIEETSERGQAKVIDSFVPLAEMFGYATNLRSLTQGRGSFTMEFNHYDPVPQNITQQIIEGKKK